MPLYRSSNSHADLIPTDYFHHYRGGGTCDRGGGGGGGNGQLQPGIVDKFLEFHVAIYIYLVAVHVCNDSLTL